MVCKLLVYTFAQASSGAQKTKELEFRPRALRRVIVGGVKGYAIG